MFLKRPLLLASLAALLLADSTTQSLPFTQAWTTTTLITANDDWSGVPGIVGYLGDYTGSSPTGVDPQTLLADYSSSTLIDVIANQSNPNTQTAAASPSSTASPIPPSP